MLFNSTNKNLIIPECIKSIQCLAKHIFILHSKILKIIILTILVKIHLRILGNKNIY